MAGQVRRRGGGRQTFQRAKRDRLEAQRKPTRYDVGFRWGSRLAEFVRGYRKYWRAQLVTLALIGAGLAVGAWDLRLAHFAGTIGQALVLAAAYGAVKLAVVHLAVVLPRIHRVSHSLRADTGLIFKQFVVALLPDALDAAAILLIGHTWWGYLLGFWASYLVAILIYAILFDASASDVRVGAFINAFSGAVLLIAWWFIGRRYLVGGG